MESSHSELLADLAVGCELAAVGRSTAAAAKAHFLDGFGTILSGASTPIGAVAREYLRAAGKEPPASPEEDAFRWGAYAFSENYGDTSLYSVAHPNTVVVPALLAAARARPVPGPRLLSGLLAGYQVMEFLARSLNHGRPRMAHQLRGFRPTASCGAAGAAAAVAHVWQLDRVTTQRSIELACNYGGGLRRFGDGSQSAIFMQSADAARQGVTSVLLALAGLEGERLMIEGDGGFFGAYRAGELDVSAAVYLPSAGGEGAPEAWAVDDTAFKFHCTAYTLATALDCLLDILRDGPVPLDSVQMIDVFVPGQHAAISASGPYRPPATPAAANNSYPYCCGVVLRTGDFVWSESLSASLDDEAVLRLAAMVRVQGDEEQARRFESADGGWPARVVVAMAGGGVRSAERREPYGTRFDAEVDRQVRRKFRRLAGSTLPEDALGRAAAAVEGIDGASSAYEVVADALRSAEASPMA